MNSFRTNTLTYMPALDGLRAIAVFMVFVIHALPRSGFPGGLGVDIFFVISGYLITSILVKEHQKSGTVDLPDFYIKRLLRLYPALILMIAVCVPAFFLLIGSWKTALLSFAAAITYTTNIVLTVFDLSGIGIVSHTWSLSMEEQYYLIWPLLLLASFRHSSRTAIATILIILTISSLTGWYFFGKESPFSPLLKLGGLAIGSLFAIYSKQLERSSNLLVFPSLLAILAAIIGESIGFLHRSITLPIVTLASPFLVLYLATHGSGVLVKALSNQVLVFVGVLSYSFYLWHYPILYMLKSAALPSWLHFTCGLALTSLFTLFSYFLLELPIQKNRPELVKRIRKFLKL
ncbi:MAG TPA: acyltransferase [Cellvibrionaceae bacterium]